MERKRRDPVAHVNQEEVEALLREIANCIINDITNLDEAVYRYKRLTGRSMIGKNDWEIINSILPPEFKKKMGEE